QRGRLVSIEPIVVVFHVREDARIWADHVIRLLTAGLQHSSESAVEWEGGWVLDDIDDRLLSGLGTLHGTYSADTFAAEANAWNLARQALGGKPRPVPSAPEPTLTPTARRDVQFSDSDADHQ